MHIVIQDTLHHLFSVAAFCDSVDFNSNEFENHLEIIQHVGYVSDRSRAEKFKKEIYFTGNK